MWLRDFLPAQLSGARIMTFGYNSTLLGSTTSVSEIKDFARDLLQRLVDDRVPNIVGNHNSRPTRITYVHRTKKDRSSLSVTLLGVL
jgi:hypothetical protein